MKQISLTQGKVALVDDADFEWLSQWKWCFSARGYAVRGKWIKEEEKTSIIRMHRIIMHSPKGMQVDHINGNALDNRRCNLRLCTQRQNSRNQLRKCFGTSKYKGVSWDKSRNKWAASIKCDYTKIYLGRFSNELDAARAYNEAAKKYHINFASLNEIAA